MDAALGRTNIGKDDELKVEKKLIVNVGESDYVQDRRRQHHHEEGRDDRHQGKGHYIEGSGKINVKASGDLVMKGGQKSRQN